MRRARDDEGFALVTSIIILTVMIGLGMGLLFLTDSQQKAFDWSGLLGGLAASALANAYYPEEERAVAKTFSRVGMGIPFSVIDHLVDEFGPHLQRKLTRKRKQPEH